MEEKLIAAWARCREQGAAAGVRMRPVEAADALRSAHRMLSGNRTSDGFVRLAELGHLEWSLEALAVDSRYTALFSDAEADEALQRLMDAGFYGLLISGAICSFIVRYCAGA